MSYKTILACLTHEDAAQRLMPAACWLADRHDAHLIGLHVEETIAIYRNVGMQVHGEVFEAFNERVSARREATRAVFEQAVARANVRGEWQVDYASTLDSGDTVMRRGATADLIVALQKGPDDGAQNHRLVERLIAGSGQPVLVIPREGGHERVGTRVVIAWDGGREAAAAVRAALPFIEQAEDVLIVVLNERSKPATEMASVGHNLATALSRHGAHATVEHHPSHAKSVAHTLLDRARGHGADLLVMGAFSHSRVHDLVFGSATGETLQDADLPVLWGR